MTPPDPQPQKVTPFGQIRRTQLYNRLNVLHYQGAPLLVCLQHKEHGHIVRASALPQPVTDEHAEARWVKDSNFPATLPAYELIGIILAGNRRTFEFTPSRYWIDEQAIHFVVPESATESKSRKRLRFSCHAQAIPTVLSQNALSFPGRLIDYSVGGLLLELAAGDQSNLAWINTAAPATVTVNCDDEPVYAGQVQVQARGGNRYLLTPSLEPAPRFVPRQHRSRRQQFVPSPDLVFTHPMTGRKHTLKVHDLGSLGFSVDEQEQSAVLLPGLLLRNATLSFANTLSLTCLAQVVYMAPVPDDRGTVRSGVAILNIEMQDHLKLISLIQQAQDPKAYVSNQIDPDDLFEFFFETGFLYPHKYAEIAGNRTAFRTAYDSLYQHKADVSRHFVYQGNGQILGHFATLRVYRQTWLNHHHAALNSHRAGLKVIRAISEYMNDSYHLNPANIRYIIGYYQETNKFPQHYFGEYVRTTNDPLQTSLDHMSYLNDTRRFGTDPGSISSDWSFTRASADDITAFQGFYDKSSGGLMANVLDLTPDNFDCPHLSQAYQANGLVRQRTLYALRHHHSLKALIDVQNSDLGLNLSEITNAITVYVLDPQACHRNMVRHAIVSLAIRYHKLDHPVMVYPKTYLASYNIESDKEYTLWAMDVARASESYMGWMNRFCR